MKSYKTIEDARKDWTYDKQQKYDEIMHRKYPNANVGLLINDRELSELTGGVKFKISIKCRATQTNN